MAVEFEPPNPRLVKPVRWRTVPHEERGEVVETWREDEKRWAMQKVWSRAVLEGLESGRSYEQMLADVDAAMGGRGGASATRKALRDYLFRLWRDGHVAMDFAPPPPRFGDRYDVVRELGRGGMGVAWLCRDTQEDRDVVVKHAWGYFQTNEKADAYTRAESDAMRAFDHPGIARLYDSFDEGGLHHIVREFVDGRALVEDDPLEGETFARLALHLADTLAHIHERGFLLVDLQKGNFLRVEPELHPVLFDVGLCQRCTDGEVRFARPAGTRGYIAPETMEHFVVTRRTDVFGLGRLLYHLTTGRLPGGRSNEADLAERMPEGRARDAVLALAADDAARRPGDGREAHALLTKMLEAPE